MKYSEATIIKGLSKKYSINNDDKSVFELIYKNKPIAWVDKLQQFNFGSVNISASGFDKLPYSHKLWMILAELAMTPIKDRVEQKKYRVIVAQDPNKYFSTYLWLRTAHNHSFLLGGIDSSYYKDHNFNTKYDLGVFTADQYKDLIKYIKTLPDGEFQAKVAEHGKTEVKGE